MSLPDYQYPPIQLNTSVHEFSFIASEIILINGNPKYLYVLFIIFIF